MALSPRARWIFILEDLAPSAPRPSGSAEVRRSSGPEWDITCERSASSGCRCGRWQPSLEGAGEVSLRRLVKETLRMRPSCIVG